MPPPPSSSRSPRLALMLLALLSAFAMSQAFRTVTAILAPSLQADFGLDGQALGAFAGLFGLSFGVAQLLMGIGVDVYGLRRTVLAAFSLAIAGSALSTLAPSYGWLMAGQLLIGVGCSPVFLASTLFVARHFPAERFAFFSGMSMGVGGLGLIFTGTPLAWVVQHWGWRVGYGVLTGLSLAAWLLVWRVVHEPPAAYAPARAAHEEREGWGQAFARMGALFTLPHTWGILVLSMSCYAAFLSLRGLWLGPLLIERFGFTLVESGNVALVLSLIALFTPAAFGRMDPGVRRRRAWIARASTLMALFFVALALLQGAGAAVATIVLMGLLSGYGVLQYADVRASYPPELTGRALSLFTMAMFLGVALMQWFTGIVAAWAAAQGWEPYRAVMLAIAAWLALASLAFRRLPASPLLGAGR
ncbi:MFS transporter [Pulveribacter sp.]|uniref:MFS transporter n=1 Tax=Pulveribacter sp. TaxID=2678893 RepID=UPI00289E3CDE|nr:MFS transporter [Pulveribacter sp.]